MRKPGLVTTADIELYLKERLVLGELVVTVVDPDATPPRFAFVKDIGCSMLMASQNPEADKELKRDIGHTQLCFIIHPQWIDCPGGFREQYT